MNMKLVDEITSKQIRHDLPEFRVGDTVRVNVTIREGQKTRVQAYKVWLLLERIAELKKLLLLERFQVVLE